VAQLVADFSGGGEALTRPQFEKFLVESLAHYQLDRPLRPAGALKAVGALAPLLPMWHPFFHLSRSIEFAPEQCVKKHRNCVEYCNKSYEKRFAKTAMGNCAQTDK
jgi:hypothetical protein